jgi:hypothetical protein
MSIKCEYCGGAGIVSMLQQPYKESTAFRCKCELGDKQENMIAKVKWNGQLTQKVGYDTFEFWYPKIIATKESEDWNG